MNIKPASEKQLYWINKLVDQKAISHELRFEIKAGLANLSITGKQAGTYLDILFDKSTPDIPVAGAVEEPGFYLHDGKVYRVVEGKQSKRLYAKLVTAHGFNFELGKGMMKVLKATDKMTVEQIVTYGLNTGICCNCSAQLSDPISMFIGLGTKCGPTLMGTEAYNAAKKIAKTDTKVAAALAAQKALAATGSPMTPVNEPETLFA